MSEIGFGQAPARTETWEKKVGPYVLVFSKTREKEKHFSYTCRCKTEGDRFVSDSSVSYETDRDIGRDEIEARQQFRGYIAGFSKYAA
jgi:hypothetical protein